MNRDLAPQGPVPVHEDVAVSLLPIHSDSSRATALTKVALRTDVGGRLEQFAAGLNAHERAAFHTLLGGGSVAGATTALGLVPPEEVLTRGELATFHRLQEDEAPAGVALRPAVVMIMKATRLCNLRCTYCNQWRDGPNQIMAFDVLARATRDVLHAPGVRHVQFVWHGGEATLLPTSFYRKALWLQQRLRRPEQVVRNAIQTNAVHLADEWLDFFRHHEVSVGVSLDGPPEIHDRRRVDRAGRPTSDRVRAGLQRLRTAGVEHGVLLVVDDDVVDVGPERVLGYLLGLGVDGVDLLNALPANTAIGAPGRGAYLAWPRYVEFLRAVFRWWWPEHAHRLRIRELSGLVQQLQGGAPGTCVFAGDCFGGFLTIDPSGDVSACDKYVDDADYRFGNVLLGDLGGLESTAALQRVRRDNQRAVDGLRACRWFSVCRGGCPHDRYTALRRRPDDDLSCCGFAPLLDDIAGQLGDASSGQGETVRSGSCEPGEPARRRAPVRVESAGPRGPAVGGEEERAGQLASTAQQFSRLTSQSKKG